METRFICLTLGAILLIHSASAQWSHIGLAGRSVSDIAAGNGLLFAIASDSGSGYRSTDGGANWVQMVQSHAADLLVAPTGTVFMIKTILLSYPVRKDTLFRSTDIGVSWSTLGVPAVYALQGIVASSSGRIFCGASHFNGRTAGWSETLISTNDGLTWSEPLLVGGVGFAFREQNIISYGSYHSLWAGGNDMSWSSDDGETWKTKDCSIPQQVGYGKIALTLCQNGDIIAGTDNGVYRSTDSCGSWTRTSAIVCEAGISLPDGCVLFGEKDVGIALFDEKADSLGVFNEGLTDFHAHTLALDNSLYVYVGTDNGIWRRPLSQIVASVEPFEDDLPGEFMLQQNYPNPFNPTTVVCYQLPGASQVRLVVYDILGREVTVLTSVNQEAGYHTATFDGSGLASGVYLYRLTAGQFVQTRKMAIVR